jgi:hypothetical protein
MIISWAPQHDVDSTTPSEPVFGTIVATGYDPKSVMHDFCGDVGSKESEMTDLDHQGAQRLYGLPLPSFQFVE